MGRGPRPGRKQVTTGSSGAEDQRPDLVERRFVAGRPQQLWVADITYVRMISGFCYVAFITDVYSRRMVGWAAAPTLHAEPLPLRALEHARLSTGVKASVGTVGDSYDYALAETVNGLYKTELIYSKRIWEAVSEVELATMGWILWWNTVRFHEALDYRTPASVEASYTPPRTTAPATV